MNNKDDKLYVIVMVQANVNIKEFSLEPLGIYRDLDLALNYVNKLEKAIPKSEVSESIFDVLEFTIDEEPIMLEFFTKQKLIMQESLEEALIKLMKNGVIDQLVGEDGHFYYRLTKLGKDRVKKIPDQIKKFFRKKRKS
jgi:DNA-binding HxlR family transcriptional regulator